VGKVDGRIVCDLDYEHDSRAEVDMNVVMRDDAFVEIQGTGEEGVFSRRELNDLLDSAGEGIAEIMRAQRTALGLEKQ
jgi:ribonuclease PH